MPFNLVWEGSGLLLDHYGVVTIEEINESNGRIFNDENFDNLHYQIIDLLGADFSHVTLANMKQPAAIDVAASLSIKRMKIALIADEPHTILLCEAYITCSQSHSSSWEFKIFDNREAARKWAIIT
ncbi:MAG: hypothetical protein K6L73_12430 [Cellvibrionaceae bacterium]